MVFEHLTSGAIGQIRLLRSSFGFPPLNKDNFRYDRELGGGVVLDVAAYTVNVSQWFLGHNLQVQGANLFVDADKKVDIYGSSTLFSPESGIASQIAFGFDNFYQCNYEIWGSEGKILVERAFTAGPTNNPKIIVEKQGIKTEHAMPADNHFINILKEFVNCIVGQDYEKHTGALLDQGRLLTELKEKAVVVSV